MDKILVKPHTIEEEREEKAENAWLAQRRAMPAQHDSFRVGKTKLKAGDRPLPHNYDSGYTITKSPDGRISKKAAVAFLTRVASDEVLASQMMLQQRRPAGVAKERFGVAVRSAVREPMLNASPEVIRNGLDWQQARPRGLAKGKVYKRIVVKPLSGRNALYGRNSSFWGERAWTVHTLKYARGFVVSTDIGDDSTVFPTYGELRSAITKSGWQIIR